MLLESARSLKAEVLETIINPFARAASARAANVKAGAARGFSSDVLGAHPLAISASALKVAPHRSVALGITRKGKEFRLALRIQRQSLVNSPLVERLTKAAHGEVDIRLVGPIEKRTTGAKRTRTAAPAKGKARVRTIKPFSLPWYQGNVRPLLIGASIAHSLVTAGTIGCFVTKNGKTFVLSNNHVLANENQAAVGDAVLQRAPYDGGGSADLVAKLAEWVPLATGKSNLMDAAIAEVISVNCGAAILKGLAAGPADRTLTGAASGDLADNATVYKLGRTTGATTGRVSAFDLSNIVVAYDMGGVRFDGVVEIESPGGRQFSAGGDSGAVVVNGQMEAAAMVFAGSDTGATYATPIAVVLNALGVQLLL